jgi:hypothetical protein
MYTVTVSWNAEYISSSISHSRRVERLAELGLALAELYFIGHAHCRKLCHALEPDGSQRPRLETRVVSRIVARMASVALQLTHVGLEIAYDYVFFCRQRDRMGLGRARAALQFVLLDGQRCQCLEQLEQKLLGLDKLALVSLELVKDELLDAVGTRAVGLEAAKLLLLRREVRVHVEKLVEHVGLFQEAKVELWSDWR